MNKLYYKEYTHDKFAKNGTITSVKISAGHNGTIGKIGSIFVSYNGAGDIIENYELLSAADFIAAIEAADFTDCEFTDEFVSAYDALKTVNDPDYAKIAAVKNAFSGITKNVTELFAIPKDGYETNGDTTLTDEEIAAFGDYYTEAVSSDVGYVSPSGSLKDYTGKQNVKFSFSYKLISGSKFKIYTYNKDWNSRDFEVSDNDVNVLKTYTKSAASMMIQASGDTYFMQAIGVNPLSSDVLVGCIYASYDEPIALPAGSEVFSAEQWIETISAMDFTGYNVSDEFKAAFTDLQAATNGYEEVAAVKNAFAGIKTTTTELFAVPNGAQSTANLSDAEKAAYGDYYATVSSDLEFSAPAGQSKFKNYTGYDNVKFFYTWKALTLKEGTNESKYEFQTGYTTRFSPNIYTTNVLKKETKSAAEFSGNANDYNISSIKLGMWYSTTIEIGSIFVSYDTPIALPEGSDFFTAEEWLTTINTIDLSGYNVTADFNAAVSNLKNHISTLRSDIDGDGICGAFDIKALAKHLLGLETVALPDINCDGKTNVADLVRIKKVVANFI